DGPLDSPIGRHASRAQVIEGAEYVVVPERRKRKLRPRLIGLAVFDHLAGRQPSEQTTIEEILLRVFARVAYRGRGAERLLEREQSFKHADRRVEGGADRAALRLAIPSAVPELFAEQTIDEPIAALAEIGAERDHTAIDARLDLTFEKLRV